MLRMFLPASRKKNFWSIDERPQEDRFIRWTDCSDVDYVLDDALPVHSTRSGESRGFMYLDGDMVDDGTGSVGVDSAVTDVGHTADGFIS